MSEPENFPGMAVFAVTGGLRPSFAGKITGSWFVARVSDVLSQVGHVQPEHRAAMYEEARHAVHAIHQCEATCLAALDWMLVRYPPPDDPDAVAAVEAKDVFSTTRPPFSEVTSSQPISKPTPRPK